jgi:outer membrane protein OmpA-like peptidoglycan-associated protein
MMHLKKGVTIVAIATLLSACAADDPNKRAKTGAAIGALVGAALGTQATDDKKKGAVIGAVVGAIAGGAAGNYMDKQQAELEKELKAEQDAQTLNIVRMSDNSLKVGVASQATFDVDKSNLKSGSLETFGKIAEVLKSYDATVIHVVGHTDSTGADSYNQSLSERRAQSVASYIGQRGVPTERLVTEGRGEREPRASNGDAAGREQNRRVDIVIKPVIEGQEQAAFDPPPPLNN